MRCAWKLTLRLCACIAAAILGAAAHSAASAPLSIWPSTAVPAVPADTDSLAVELGVKFRADQAGTISGIRFYKSATNTGVHVANLWSASGQLLATANFPNETASGWQQANFATPVAISPNTVYIASYHTNTGHYASDVKFFSTKGADNGPLHALKDGVAGPNGVYAYGSGSQFPTTTYLATNYWVDVVFNPASGPCPCSVWPAAAVPVVAADTDSLAVELGMKFQTDSSGVISGIRFYKSAPNTGAHVANLWTATGQLLATATFANETASGWQQANFTTPVSIAANTVYVASYHTNTGHYAGDAGYFATSGVDSGPLHALKNGVSGGNGVYAYGASAFPSNSYQSSNYWVDVVFNTTGGGDTTPPTVTAQTPAAGAGSVPTTASVTATFSEPVQSSTITFTLKNGATVVPATVTYDNATRIATLQRGSPLAAGTAYTASVSGAKDLANNMMSPVTWSFTTAGGGGSSICPCTIWPSTTIPEFPADPDKLAVELGVKFRADFDGTITAIRFYKMAFNTGQHLGHLWDKSGTLLATATFTNETTSGWQQASFSTPVPVKAGVTYIASYHTNVGRYADDIDYFAAGSFDRGPLHALQDGADGPNGVYAYGAGTAFPNQTWRSSNYWVDVVYTTNNAPAVPLVIDQSPLPHAVGVSTETAVAATFNESVQPNTVVFTLTGPGNSAVATTFTYDDTTHTASVQPTNSLAEATAFTATVSGATDAAGHTMASPVTWSFTTASNSVGQWSAIYDWPCVSIHTHLLPDGNILSWADDDGPNGSRNGGSTKTYVVPIPTGGAPGTPIAVPNTQVNLFCSGHTFLPDGRLITTGGHTGIDGYGADSVVIFEGQNGQYSWNIQPQKMNQGRWYPSTVGLATGEALVLGGSYAAGQYNNLPEVWLTNSGGGFRDLTNAQLLVKFYPKMHLAPNGKLFMAGPDPLTRYLDTSGTGQWTNVGNRLFGGRDYGSSVVYDDGKILIAGGGDPPTATAEIIDLNATSPTWQWTGTMKFARRQMNATVLPDGKVLVTGGTGSPGFNDATNAVLAAEMWDPATGVWTTLASMQVSRLYHSTAVLLPDGRVLSAGGGRPPATNGGTDNWNAEFYSPPYLFKGARPTITSAPTSVSYGQVFSVQTPNAASITKVTLVRLSSVTHSFNMNQRFKRLSFAVAGNALNVTTPTDRNITPPGHYMLFILNSAGVPSVAKIIQIK